MGECPWSLCLRIAQGRQPMRITIEKGFQPLIEKVMTEIGVDEPRLALNQILGTYAASRQATHPPVIPVTPAAPDEDEFSQLADWS